MRTDRKIKEFVVLYNDELARLATEVFGCRAMIKSVERMNKAKVENIKGMISDLGDVKVRAGEMIMDLVPRAGSLDVDEFKKGLIASGVDPLVIEEESERAKRSPSVTLRIVAEQDQEAM